MFRCALLGLTLWCGTSAAQAADSVASVLDDLERRAVAYFLDHHHPQTGLVRDRAANFPDAPPAPRPRMASIAATGYYLSVLPEAVRRGWIARPDALVSARRVVESVARLEHHHGVLYHFVDWETGRRWEKSEISTLDTAILFNGLIVAGGGFPELAAAADAILHRADWPRFVIQRDGKRLLSLGYLPEQGLLGPVNVRTSEMAMPLWLALGSPKSVDVECWYNTTTQSRSVAGRELPNGELPLFVSYYGLGWANLADLRDREGIDLFAVARQAALANRSFCRQVAAPRYKSYRPELGGWWGISAGDSARGYVAPGPVESQVDGTVWPCTALAAMPWAQAELSADLAAWRASPLWPKVLGSYGLAPFNADSGWIGREIIGIDLGALLVNLANQRQRTVWDLWHKHPIPRRALQRLEIKPSAAPP